MKVRSFSINFWIRFTSNLFAVAFIIQVSSCSGVYVPHDDYVTNQNNGPGPPSGMPSEPGKCYAKSLIDDMYSVSTVEFFEYLGEPDDEQVELEVIELSPKTTKWEKRNIVKDCESANPEDCRVWCLVDVPAQYITIVKDTSQTSNWVKTIDEVKVLEKQGGFTEWNEVVCNKDITPQLHKNIKRALTKYGYNTGETTSSEFRAQAKAALVKYQRDNNLPVGNIDYETLESLGVKVQE